MLVVLRRLEAEADEMWSFVQKKANKQWIWIAMDRTTRQIIAFHGVTGVARVPKRCGPTFRWSTGNRRHSIPINMTRILGSSRQNVTRRSRSKHGKPITSNASTIPCGNVLPVWCARPSRSPKSWRLTSARLSISFATTISRGLQPQHYLCSTTAPGTCTQRRRRLWFDLNHGGLAPDNMA